MAAPARGTTLEGMIGGLPGVDIFGLNTNKPVNFSGFLVDASGNITVPGTVAITGAQTFTGALTANGGIVMGNRLQTKEKSSAIASANNLTLTTDGNVFHISGTTQINLIETSGWQAGSEITLIFEGTVLLKNNQAPSGTLLPIIVSAGTDLTVHANDVATFVYDSIGTAWFLKSFSDNSV